MAKEPDINKKLSKVTYEGVEIDLQGSGGASKAEVYSDFLNHNGTFQGTTYEEIDLSGVDTSGATKMYNTFSQCQYAQKIDVSSFNTDNVTDMSNMFYGCSVVTNLNVSNFNTEKVENMQHMFSGCLALTNLNVSNFNTNNVTSMAFMFVNCNNLTNLDVSNFNTSNVTDMAGMFQWCYLIPTLDVSKFDTSKVTNMASMFQDCSSLINLDVSNFNTSNVTDMNNMLYGLRGLQSLDISNFSYKSIVDIIYYFIYDNTSLTTLKLGFEIPQVDGTILYNCPIQQILVPKGTLEAYQTATNWSNFAQYMKEYDIPETTYIFVTDGGSPVASVTTNEGLLTSPVSTPNDTYLVFDGWYLNSDFTQKVDFPYNNLKGGTITMYAKYAEPAPISRVMAKTIKQSDIGTKIFNDFITENNEPSTAGGNGWKASWYKFTPEITGNYYISDYLEHNYIGQPITDMDVVIENADGSLWANYNEYGNTGVRQLLEAGKTYYFAISGWGDILGELYFKLNME